MRKSEIELCKKAINQFEDMEDSYNIIVKALNKQIPLNVRNPINEAGKYNKAVKYCYACGNIGIKNMKYCPHCGQRLNWEVYKDREEK